MTRRMVLLRLHALSAAVFVGAIAIQVFLAGLAITNFGGSGDFSLHADFGYTWVGLAVLMVVVTALLAKTPKRDVGISLALLGLYIVQTLLPAAKESVPAIAALHPLNAMILFVLAVWYARDAWRAALAPTAAQSTA